MMNATEFYNISVQKQREFLDKAIQSAQEIGNPIVELPFDTYPVIEAEMAAAGWKYDAVIRQDTCGNKRKYAVFFPAEYCYPDE